MSTIDWLLRAEDAHSSDLPLWCHLTDWWLDEYPDPDDEPSDGWLVIALSPIALPAALADERGAGVPLEAGWNFWIAGDQEALTDLVVALADWTSAALVIDLAEGGADAIAQVTDDLRKDQAR